MLRPLLVVSSLIFAYSAQAAEAGKVIYATGTAQVADKAGVDGMPVQEGELLSTGNDSYLYVKTIDNGLFILRPNTKARIVAYHVDLKKPANTRIKLELISGVARSKSGDAVKMARQNFRFNTPVAAIGVRGTDFTVYTDQETSKVTVLTGGVVMSGFAGNCSPDGAGPCEGAASRELFASQRGQQLQVKRGDTAPQLVQSNGTGPDQVAPPRADEPVATVKGGGANVPVLDAKKSDTLDKLVSQTPPPPKQTPVPDPVTIPALPPPEVSPVPQPPPVAQEPVPTPVPVPTPPVVKEPEPQLPERAIQWGRWVALADRPATIDNAAPAGGDRLLGRDYVVIRSAGRDYVAPERGNASFVLKGGEATIRSEDQSSVVTTAALKNGLLAVDFGKASFTTSFDIVSGNETFNMKADGLVASNGRFGNSSTDVYKRPQENNMSVDGILSNENGGAASYLFLRRLDDKREINGVTAWGIQK